MAPDEMTTIASRVASICNQLDDVGDQTMSVRRIAAISAMILDR